MASRAEEARFVPGFALTIDAHGRPGVDGACALDAENPGAPGGNGGDGTNATPARDFTILLNKIISEPGNQEGEEQRVLEYIVDGTTEKIVLGRDHMVIFIDAHGAKGGDGGKGGNGSAGANGANGTDGADAEDPGIDGADGTDGDKGQDGGDGGNGGNAGLPSRGGTITIQAFDPLLFALVEVDVCGGGPSIGGSGGLPGGSSTGGKGGVGGRGGPAPKRQHWYSLRSPVAGHSGKVGNDGGSGQPGHLGKHGDTQDPAPNGHVVWQELKGTPDRFEVVCQGDDRWNPKIISFTMTDDDNDGIYCPGRGVHLSHIMINNAGHLPLPQGLQISARISSSNIPHTMCSREDDDDNEVDVLVEADFCHRTAESDKLRTRKAGGEQEPQPGTVVIICERGETHELCNSIALQCPDVPVQINQTTHQKATVVVTCWALGRVFRESAMEMDFMELFPVNVLEVSAPCIGVLGDSGRIRIVLQNQSNNVYGTPSSPIVLQLGSRLQTMSFGSEHGFTKPGHKLVTEVKSIKSGERRRIDLDWHVSDQSAMASLLSNQLVNLRVTLRGDLIAQNRLSLRIVPEFDLDQFYHAILVTTASMTTTELHCWRFLLSSLSLSFSIWDMELNKECLRSNRMDWSQRCQLMLIPNASEKILKQILLPQDALAFSEQGRGIVLIGDSADAHCFDYALYNHLPIAHMESCIYQNRIRSDQAAVALRDLQCQQHANEARERIAKKDANYQLLSTLNTRPLFDLPAEAIPNAPKSGLHCVYRALVPRCSKFFAVKTPQELHTTLDTGEPSVLDASMEQQDRRAAPISWSIDLFTDLGKIVLAILKAMPLSRLCALITNADSPLKWKARDDSITVDQVLLIVINQQLAQETKLIPYRCTTPFAVTLQEYAHDHSATAPGAVFAAAILNQLNDLGGVPICKCPLTKIKMARLTLADIFSTIVRMTSMRTGLSAKQLRTQVSDLLQSTSRYLVPIPEVVQLTDHTNLIIKERRAMQEDMEDVAAVDADMGKPLLTRAKMKSCEALVLQQRWSANAVDLPNRRAIGEGVGLFEEGEGAERAPRQSQLEKKYLEQRASERMARLQVVRGMNVEAQEKQDRWQRNFALWEEGGGV